MLMSDMAQYNYCRPPPLADDGGIPYVVCVVSDIKVLLWEVTTLIYKLSVRG